ncbi:hypothetical protein FLM48_14955 [Shewanella sp. Scap07]|uniref:hypothetical protein n=1 Tax=Shewanella sp. Scap07 TaxID=2589987 RepID=UPI0015BF96B1|nr:hypothetical protein [Shewanella sp. Scap07]QLE86255.1 hypothetical protein FLM48_14955 [Shewanella sp. Scap07]
MKKTSLAIMLSLLIVGCDSNNPNDGTPTPPEDNWPPAEELVHALYISSEKSPNCGIAGVEYTIYDTQGAVLISGESNENGAILLEDLPEDSRYLSYFYRSQNPDFKTWSSATYEISLISQASKVLLHAIDDGDVAQCAAIQDSVKSLSFVNQSGGQQLQYVANGVLSQDVLQVNLAEESPLLVTSHDDAGQLLFSELFDTRDFEAQDEVTVTASIESELLTVESPMSADRTVVQYSQYPLAADVMTEAQDATIWAPVADDEAAIIVRQSSVNELKMWSQRRQAQAQQIAFDDISDYQLDVEFPSHQDQGDNLATQVTFELQGAAEQMDFVGHYADRIYTGGGPFCAEDPTYCRYIYRNVYTASQNSSLFIAPLPEDVKFHWMGGGITNQALIVAERDDVGMLQTLAAGEASDAFALGYGAADLDKRLQVSPLVPMPVSAQTREEFELRYSRDFNAVASAKVM